MKILLVGSAGQLGRALQATLRGHTVVACTHQELDIVRLSVVREALAAHAPDVVINAAAYNNVDGAETDPDAAFACNALGPRNLALATAARRIPVLHMSTDYVFDGRTARPYHEFDRPAPLSTYGASKLAGEEAVRALNPRHYIVRTAWLYHTMGRNFARTMCGLAERPEVRVVSDQYGSPTFAPHLADAIARLVVTEAFGTYHLAGNGGASWFEWTQTLYEELDIGTPVRPVSRAEFPRAAARPAYSVLTTRQDPAIVLPPWQDGVAAFVATLRYHGADTPI
jgi:dTDP-4-dehydrorhamnose reductase